MIVLDASAAVSWLLDEPSPASGLSDLITTQRILVPAHWSVEVGHSILKALRRKRISDDRLRTIEVELQVLNLAIEPPLDITDFFPLLAFAREHGLTMYDAAYVHLAIERQAELATLDGAMRHAAEQLGVNMAL